MPRFKYNRNIRKFVTVQKTSDNDMDCLLPFSPLPKSFLFANRYEVVLQRVLHNPLFADESKGFTLRPIEFLLSSGTKVRNSYDQGEDGDDGPSAVAERPNVIILGCLIQLKNAQWYLEDVTNLVKLDFSQTRFHQVSSYPLTIKSIFSFVSYSKSLLNFFPRFYCVVFAFVSPLAFLENN